MMSAPPWSPIPGDADPQQRTVFVSIGNVTVRCEGSFAGSVTCLRLMFLQLFVGVLW